MDMLEALKARHSVRSYTDQELSSEERQALQQEIDACNSEGGLHIQLVCDEPTAFSSTLARYGKFSGVRNYLVLAAPPAGDLEERCGYYGERLVLFAQAIGLNTCWVALTFKRRYVRSIIPDGEELVMVIAIGHGATQGTDRKSKGVDQVSSVPADMEVPAWFEAGVCAALLAPTAINQQKFFFELTGETDANGLPTVAARSTGGPHSKVDLGIVCYHFEVGAGKENFAWAYGADVR